MLFDQLHQVEFSKYPLEILWKSLSLKPSERKFPQIPQCVKYSEYSEYADCERKNSEKLIENRLKTRKNKTQPINERHLRFEIIFLLFVGR